MRVNGEQVALPAPQTLLDFLQAQGYTPQRVAVELRGAVVPRAAFAETLLTDDDTLEIVAFVGGG